MSEALAATPAPPVSYPEDREMAILVSKVLSQQWLAEKGTEADIGNFWPNPHTCYRLRQLLNDMGGDALVKFLKDNLSAWFVRCTYEAITTPFFVNSHLLAESHLAWYVENRGRLEYLRNVKKQAPPWETLVHDRVLAGETEFLDTCLLPGRPLLPHLEMHWVLACTVGIRWGKSNGIVSTQVVEYNSKLVPMEEAVRTEYKTLQSSKTKLMVYWDKVQQAMDTAAYHWLDNLGFGVTFKDEMNRPGIRITGPAKGRMTETSWRCQLHGSGTLADRDARLISIVREIKGLPPLGPQDLKPITFERQAKSTPTGNLNPAFQAALSTLQKAAENDDDFED